VASDDAIDPLQQAQTLNILVAAGIKTREEARADLGLAPEGGKARRRRGGIGAPLAPALTDRAFGRQMPGGAAHDCKIVGVPVRDAGDLDGDGLAVVSVRLVAA
jgi:hypothetical protein